jgi:hypothetical protein
MIATGSETKSENFSFTLLFWLSETVKEITNSHCHGNGKLIIDGFQSHCLVYLKPSAEVMSRLYHCRVLHPIATVADGSKITHF